MKTLGYKGTQAEFCKLHFDHAHPYHQGRSLFLRSHLQNMGYETIPSHYYTSDARNKYTLVFIEADTLEVVAVEPDHVDDLHYIKQNMADKELVQWAMSRKLEEVVRSEDTSDNATHLLTRMANMIYASTADAINVDDHLPDPTVSDDYKNQLQWAAATRLPKAYTSSTGHSDVISPCLTACIPDPENLGHFISVTDIKDPVQCVKGLQTLFAINMQAPTSFRAFPTFKPYMCSRAHASGVFDFLMQVMARYSGVGLVAYPYLHEDTDYSKPNAILQLPPTAPTMYMLAHTGHLALLHLHPETKVATYVESNGRLNRYAQSAKEFVKINGMQDWTFTLAYRNLGPQANDKDRLGGMCAMWARMTLFLYVLNPDKSIEDITTFMKTAAQDLWPHAMYIIAKMRTMRMSVESICRAISLIQSSIGAQSEHWPKNTVQQNVHAFWSQNNADQHAKVCKNAFVVT